MRCRKVASSGRVVREGYVLLTVFLVPRVVQVHFSSQAVLLLELTYSQGVLELLTLDS